MSKQSSIEWLIGAIESLEENRLKRIISIDEYDDNLEFVKDKAKQMHKEELIEFGNDCLEYMVTDWKGQQTVGEEYYQETYGGNNE